MAARVRVNIHGILMTGLQTSVGKSRRCFRCFGLVLVFLCFVYVVMQLHVLLMIKFDGAMSYATLVERGAEARKYPLGTSLLRHRTLRTVNPPAPTTPHFVEPSGLWPDPADRHNDRILSQIDYMSLLAAKLSNQTDRVKLIFVADGLGDLPEGRQKFLDDQCPVSTCHLTGTMTKFKLRGRAADMVLFHGAHYRPPVDDRHVDQIWILYQLESPWNTMKFGEVFHQRAALNWTATYRSDSTIVAPYEKWVQFKNVTSLPSKPTKNYAAGKTKKVAWFVSNCWAENNRLLFAESLAKHIDVDIFGACGTEACPRGFEHCDLILKEKYKFYLSFENSNCEHYVTEKFFHNALQNDILPIVMGARPEDYAAVAPPHSFIHVDDFPDAHALAQYLLKLDADDALYNQYFAWKGTGQFIDTKWWCRLCSLLHYDGHVRTWYSAEQLDKWWYNNRTCTTGRWHHV